MKRSISYKFVTLKRKIREDFCVPIYLQISQYDKRKYISTGIFVGASQWNASKERVRKSHPHFRVLNAQLEDLNQSTLQIIQDTPEEQLNLDSLKELLTQQDPQTIDFIEIYQEFSKKLLQDGHVDEHRHARVLIRKLQQFSGSERLGSYRINPTFVRQFQQFLFNELKNSSNTVNKEMQRFKRVYTYAKDQKYVSGNPFSEYKALRRTKSSKARLTLEQIQQLEALQLAPGSRECLVRDAFLFSFYNAGIRFGDLVMLTWEHIIDGRLVYKMGKTGQEKSIKLQPQAITILNTYKKSPHRKKNMLFPVIEHAPMMEKGEFNKLKNSKNVTFNKTIKKVSGMIGIEESVSFHVSRHSFADYARKMNVHVTDIKSMLGHSSIAVTEAYLSEFDEQKMDDEMDRLFGK